MKRQSPVRPGPLEALTGYLQQFQNRDGGWGFRSGSSWTEPTALAVLTLDCCGERESSRLRLGREWLIKNQLGDGGWSPNFAVDQSTYVTALAFCALCGVSSWQGRAPALNWLFGRSGRNWQSFAAWRHLISHQELDNTDGWPWFPGTAAWVMPTAFSVIALQMASGGGSFPAISKRVQAGREFLLSRICADSGWSYGLPRALDIDLPSYPETTGAALVALQGAPPQRLRGALDRAYQYAATCRSGYGAGWLRLGLLAHGRVPPRGVARCRGVLDASMLALAEAAQQGSVIFGVQYVPQPEAA